MTTATKESIVSKATAGIVDDIMRPPANRVRRGGADHGSTPDERLSAHQKLGCVESKTVTHGT